MNRIIHITLVLQAIGISLFFIWMVMRPTGADPSQPFIELQMFTDRYGPDKAVNALGPTIFQKLQLSAEERPASKRATAAIEVDGSR